MCALRARVHLCVCHAEGATVPERHSRAIFHLARQRWTAVSAMAAAALDLKGRMDKDMDRQRRTHETCPEPAFFEGGEGDRESGGGGHTSGRCSE